jgi:hypothetical protein
MDYTYREGHSEALYRFKDGMLPMRLLPPQARSFRLKSFGFGR